MKNRIKTNGYMLIEVLISLTIIGVITTLGLINIQKINIDYNFDRYSLNLTNDIRMLQEKSVTNSDYSYSMMLYADGYDLKENMTKFKKVKFKKNFILVDKNDRGFKRENIRFRYDGGMKGSSDGITIFVKNINESKYKKITIAAIGGRVKLYEKTTDNLY